MVSITKDYLKTMKSHLLTQVTYFRIRRHGRQRNHQTEKGRNEDLPGSLCSTVEAPKVEKTDNFLGRQHTNHNTFIMPTKYNKKKRRKNTEVLDDADILLEAVRSKFEKEKHCLELNDCKKHKRSNTREGNYPERYKSNGEKLIDRSLRNGECRKPDRLTGHRYHVVRHKKYEQKERNCTNKNFICHNPRTCISNIKSEGNKFYDRLSQNRVEAIRHYQYRRKSKEIRDSEFGRCSTNEVFHNIAKGQTEFNNEAYVNEMKQSYKVNDNRRMHRYKKNKNRMNTIDDTIQLGNENMGAWKVRDRKVKRENDQSSTGLKGWKTRLDKRRANTDTPSKDRHPAREVNSKDIATDVCKIRKNKRKLHSKDLGKVHVTEEDYVNLDALRFSRGPLIADRLDFSSNPKRIKGEHINDSVNSEKRNLIYKKMKQRKSASCHVQQHLKDDVSHECIRETNTKRNSSQQVSEGIDIHQKLLKKEDELDSDSDLANFTFPSIHGDDDYSSSSDPGLQDYDGIERKLDLNETMYLYLQEADREQQMTQKDMAQNFYDTTINQERSSAIAEETDSLNPSGDLATGCTVKNEHEKERLTNEKHRMASDGRNTKRSKTSLMKDDVVLVNMEELMSNYEDFHSEEVKNEKCDNDSGLQGREKYLDEARAITRVLRMDSDPTNDVKSKGLAIKCVRKEEHRKKKHQSSQSSDTQIRNVSNQDGSSFDSSKWSQGPVTADENDFHSRPKRKKDEYMNYCINEEKRNLISKKMNERKPEHSCDEDRKGIYVDRNTSKRNKEIFADHAEMLGAEYDFGSDDDPVEFTFPRIFGDDDHSSSSEAEMTQNCVEIEEELDINTVEKVLSHGVDIEEENEDEDVVQNCHNNIPYKFNGNANADEREALMHSGHSAIVDALQIEDEEESIDNKTQKPTSSNWAVSLNMEELMNVGEDYSSDSGLEELLGEQRKRRASNPGQSNKEFSYIEKLRHRRKLAAEQGELLKAKENKIFENSHLCYTRDKLNDQSGHEEGIQEKERICQEEMDSNVDAESTGNEGAKTISRNEDTYQRLRMKWKLNPADLEQMRREAIKFEYGIWTRDETEILENNIMEVCKTTNMSLVDVKKLLIDKSSAGRKTRTEVGIYPILASGLNRRLSDIVNKLRQIVNPDNYKGGWTFQEERKVLKLYKTYGVQWSRIANDMARSVTSVHNKIRRLLRGKLCEGLDNVTEVRAFGPWKRDEEERLIEAVEESLKKNKHNCDKRYRKKDKINWEAVTTHVKTRNSEQCRLKWAYDLSWKKPGQKANKWTNQELAKFLTLLSECGEKYEKHVNWVKLGKDLEKPESGVVLRVKWLHFKRQVPGYKLLEFQEILDWLMNNKVPRLLGK